MIEVNTHEAKTKLSALLQLVEKHHEWVRICRNGTPIADLRPIARSHDVLCQSDDLKDVVFNEDPTAPLTEEDRPSYAR